LYPAVAPFGVRPRLGKRGLRRGHRRIDLIARRTIGMADHRTSELVGDRERFTTVDPFPSDEETATAERHCGRGFGSLHGITQTTPACRRRAISSHARPSSVP